MTEILKQPVPHTYLVAGGGGGMRSTVILRVLAQELNGRGLPYTSVEGIRGTGDDQAVHHPTLQVQDMEADISNRPKETPLLFISHCIGTISALGTVERLADTRPAALVAIAPPLPSPRNTISAPQSQRKRSENDSLMRVVDLPPGALDYSAMTESHARISPQYFTDIHAADDLEKRLRRQIEEGTSALFAPEHDWNVASPHHVRGWHAEWSATWPPEEAAWLRTRAAIVPDAAHGLYLSPRAGRQFTAEEDVAFQAANVRQVVDTGLELLTSAGMPPSSLAA
jgi:hypothetical protein